MKKELFNHYDKLGFMNPNYIKRNNKLVIKENFIDIIKEKETPNIIDSTSIIEILNRGYTFADRTIIKDIYKSPWMAKPNNNLTSWEYVNYLPNHDLKMFDEQDIADNLFSKLLVEIKEYIGENKNIGILLSGGMDSRIIASVIKHLQDTKEINVNVIAFTWGLENSRDVIYAKRIVDLFHWDWKYFKLTSEDLFDNIDTTSINGSFYSPVHLHCMPKIREINDIDCIIAGSFGDSIGRAEYSGVKVQNLTSISKVVMNRFKILKNDVFKKYKSNIYNDIQIYNDLFPREEKYHYYEVEKQLHYMRKQLNSCMSIINQKIPLYQAFTSPEVFGYMWSIAPEKRNDKIYYNILKKYNNSLLQIPWARTGSIYLSNDNPSDNFSKESHTYGKWIREDLYSEIKKKVLSDEINNMNIFNMDSLENLFWINSFSKQNSLTKIDEQLIWIASLSNSIKTFKIENNDINKNNSIYDKFDGNITSLAHYIAFYLKLKL